jgi:hypothetical protein
MLERDIAVPFLFVEWFVCNFAPGSTTASAGRRVRCAARDGDDTGSGRHPPHHVGYGQADFI